jgi:hypothetical protein
MAKPTSPHRRRPWTEADAQRVLDEWRRSDPQAYLADVLPRLTGCIRIKDLPDLLPSRWAAARAAASAASPSSTPS